MAERVVLIDGSSLLYRAFYALPTLTSASGLHTNAAFGFANMFKKVLAGRAPTYGAVVFDAPGGSFRQEQYEDYKANRRRMPDELREQLPWIDKLVEAQRFALLRVPGVEADDVIGTLTRQALAAGYEVHVVSTDKDFVQLIGDDVRMVDTMKDVSYDPELVRKRWGIKPAQMADYLALVGDKSDNIPGVPGIGAKGAAKLLAEHGDLEGILAAREQLKGRARKALLEHEEEARLSKQLATIKTDVELPLTLEQLRWEGPDPQALGELYRELQLYSLLTTAQVAEEAKQDGVYRSLETPEEARRTLEALAAQGTVVVLGCFQASTPPHSPLVGLALAAQPGEAWYLPLQAPGHTVDLGHDDWAFLRAWLEDAAQPKASHDAKELYFGLRRLGITLRGVSFDTMLGSFLVDPTGLIPHRLDQCTKEYLQRTVQPLKTLLGSGKSLRRWSEAPLEEATAYAGHLADAVIALLPVVRLRVEDAAQLEQLQVHDLPLSWVLAEMELTGVRVDADDLAALGREFHERLQGYQKRVHELAGRSFNLNSAKQLGEVLFDELGLPVIKRTKTGYSTTAEVLERLAAEHEIAQQVLEYRKLAKLINTYTDVLQRELNPETGRIHATIQQTTGATGRLITTQPDLQRTPTRTPEGHRIRQAFVAAPGWKLISADWNQIELRYLAHLSEDPGLLEAFRDGVDVHRRTAGQLFDVAPDAVTPEQRNVGKTVNFATIYGQGATALGQILGVPRKQAKAYIEGYFEAYAGVREWLDETIAEALERGWVETYLGRRRLIPELSSRDPMIRAAGERIAANTPIQGSAADLCKEVMLQVPQRFREAGLQARMVLQIHDELLVEAPAAEAEAAAAILRDRMEHVLELRVPLEVEVGIGQSWAAAHG